MQPSTLGRKFGNLFVLCAVSFTLGSVVYSVGAGAQPARKRGPCVEQAQVRHRAQMALRACMEEWMKDRPGTPEPSEDCSAKLSSFTQAAKLVRECRAVPSAPETK